MRLIDADKYRDVLVGWMHNCFHQILARYDGYDEASDAIASCIEELDNQPTIESVKHGRWEWFCNEPIEVNGHTCYSYGYRCTACRNGGTCWICEGKLSESEELFYKNLEPVEDKYCSECGARMDLEE